MAAIATRPVTSNNMDVEDKPRPAGIDWLPLMFVTSMHIGALIGFVMFPMTWSGFSYMLVMYTLTGLGITVGYHRLWSHRSYRAVLPYRAWWAFWGAGALQGSILWWSRLHRYVSGSGRWCVSVVRVCS